MRKCPDCDAIRIGSTLLSPSEGGEGNGVCSECHGTKVQTQFTFGLTDADPCRNCNGSGECPTCRGEGVLDD